MEYSARDKIWRIRDAVHNIIEFDGLDPLEGRLWRCIQTAPFQRLRRIKQLGFSEFVYPGATHTRFAHSLGVFHTARRLIAVIKKFEKLHGLRYDDQHAAPALAAALLHDIGHGMFSHAFEAVGKENGWAMAHHEDVSEKLIREGEIAEILNGYYSGFANNVAEVIRDKKEIPPNLFHAVVSGQFDADRLDYMQRDRLMTGVRSSHVDMEWLFANLEVGDVQADIDGEKLDPFQTLVLNSKALETAENYVFSLFHLYPSIYYHKATRGLEVLFQALIRRIAALIAEDNIEATGLNEQHPLIRFILKPDNLGLTMALDDTILFGSLFLLCDAKDTYIKKCAICLRQRQPLKCVDIKGKIAAARKMPGDKDKEELFALCNNVISKIKAESEGKSERSLFCDVCERVVYKDINVGDTDKRHQRIMIKQGGGCADIRDLSAAIRHAKPYKAYRAYYFRDDNQAERRLDTIIAGCINKNEVNSYAK